MNICWFSQSASIQPIVAKISFGKPPSLLPSIVRLYENKPHFALGRCPHWNNTISRAHLPDYNDQFRFGHIIQTAKCQKRFLKKKGLLSLLRVLSEVTLSLSLGGVAGRRQNQNWCMHFAFIRGEPEGSWRNHRVESMTGLTQQDAELRSWIFVIVFELHFPCTSKYVS